MTEEKRGSKGGNARKEKLSPEKRKEIAKLAAQKRWAKRKDTDIEKLTVTISDDPTTVSGSAIQSPIIYGPAESPVSEAPEDKEKHCPACVAGQSLEEGEGTHILATVEHPVTLPAAFADAESVIAIPETPTPPQKPAKSKPRKLPKQFKEAGTYAEKRVLEANRERAEHIGEIAKLQSKIKELDAEINGLLPIIKALGGTVDPQAVQQQGYGNLAYQQPSYAPQVPNLPAPYPEYQPPISGQLPMNATPPTTVTVPRPMKMGGARALDFSGIIND